MVEFERNRLQTIPMPRPVLIRRAIKITLITTLAFLVPLTFLFAIYTWGLLGGFIIGFVISTCLEGLPIIVTIRRLNISIANKEAEIGFNYQHYNILLTASLGKVLGSWSEKRKVVTLMILISIISLSSIPLIYLIGYPVFFWTSNSWGIIVICGLIATYIGISIPHNRAVDRNWLKAQELGIAIEAEACPECDWNMYEGKCPFCKYETNKEMLEELEEPIQLCEQKITILVIKNGEEIEVLMAESEKWAIYDTLRNDLDEGRIEAFKVGDHSWIYGTPSRKRALEETLEE